MTNANKMVIRKNPSFFVELPSTIARFRSRADRRDHRGSLAVSREGSSSVWRAAFMERVF